MSYRWYQQLNGLGSWSTQFGVYRCLSHLSWVEPVVTIGPTPFLLQLHFSPLNLCMKSDPGLPQQGVHSQIQGSKRERETICITLGLSKPLTSGGCLGSTGPCHHLCLVKKLRESESLQCRHLTAVKLWRRLFLPTEYHSQSTHFDL